MCGCVVVCAGGCLYGADGACVWALGNGRMGENGKLKESRREQDMEGQRTCGEEGGGEDKCQQREGQGETGTREKGTQVDMVTGAGGGEWWCFGGRQNGTFIKCIHICSFNQIDSPINIGYIAQWLERLIADQQVPGSNPGVPYQLPWVAFQEV